MYKVTLTVKYLELGFIFDDIANASLFVDDVLKRHDKKDKLTVTISLVEREVKEDDAN